MPSKQITITNVNGAEPYQVSICDGTFGTCYYYDTIFNIDIPYNILVPIPLNSLGTYGVKLIDSNGCEIKDTIVI